MKRTITLLTDFGLKDPYVASMKGVILSINPEAYIVDISHEVFSHNIKEGALLLWASYSYFPEGTIHVAVVDPGVGTVRKPIVIKSRRYFFIGPDNGLLTMASLEDGLVEAREITNPNFMLSKVSRTFHGRDIFAPTAARLSLGAHPRDVGPVLKEVVTMLPPTYTLRHEDLLGEVVHIDRFGNIITSIPEGAAEAYIGYGGWCEVEVGKVRVEAKLVKAYGEVDEGEPLLIPNSFNLLELAINRGDAAARFKVKVGDAIEIRKFSFTCE